MSIKTYVECSQRPSDRSPVILRSSSYQNRLDFESKISRLVDLLFRITFFPGGCFNVESTVVNQDDAYAGGSESDWADIEDNLE